MDEAVGVICSGAEAPPSGSEALGSEGIASLQSADQGKSRALSRKARSEARDDKAHSLNMTKRIGVEIERELGVCRVLDCALYPTVLTDHWS